MTVFISHSSRDGGAVGTLVDHIEAANEAVWLDKKLSGGQAWWDEILSQIRSCTVFVVALSNNSRASKPCQAELEYAKALGLPILPVQIGDTDWYLIDPVFTNVIDYRTPNAERSIKLITSLRAAAATRSGLPDPLPAPPPVPYEYLQRIGVTIESPETLSPTEQSRIVMELRSSMVSESDPSVVKDIRHVLRALRRRPDATFTTVSDIDELLAEEETPTSVVPPPPAHREPTTPQPLVSVPSTHPPVPPTPATHPQMPSWGAAPRPASSRGKWIALGVGAVALAGIVAVVIWLAVRPDPSKGNASAGTSTTTSTTSTTESTETSATTTPSTDSDDEARLRAMLPKGYTESACRHGEPPAGGTARLDCKANTLAGGPSAASYVVFSDQSSLDDTFDNLIRAGGLKLVNCPGLDENPTAWHLRTTPSVDEGRVTCGQYEKNPDLYTLMWTHNSKLFFGGADGADLDGLYKWWQEHT